MVPRVWFGWVPVVLALGVSVNGPFTCAPRAVTNSAFDTTPLISPLYIFDGPFWMKVVSGGLNGPAPRPSFFLLPLKKVKLPRTACVNAACSFAPMSSSVVLSGKPSSVWMFTSVRPYEPQAHTRSFISGPPSSPP